MPVRIAVLDDYQSAAARFGDWRSLGDVEMVPFQEHVDDVGELAARLDGFDVVVAMRERTALPAELFARLDGLRLVVTTGPRNPVIDVHAAAAASVTVAGTLGTVAPTVELTWGLVLALLRHIPREDAAVRDGRWQHTMGTELKGKTMGLLGLGRIGKRVARVAGAFGMQVVTWSQNLTVERAEEAGASLVSREELFRISDVVSVHLVLSDRTRGLVGATELASMKPTAVLVNTSRGPIVDERALVAALESGAIAGAGLDVFDTEPLPIDHPLRRAPNTVLTPHIGYVTDALYQQFYDEIVEDIAAWMKGEPVRVIAGPGYVEGAWP